MKLASTLLLTVALHILSHAQNRAVPHPIPNPPGWGPAIEAGTRTADGHPGENYWTNHADYHIKAELDPETAMVSGRIEIDFRNNSDISIRRLRVHLRQNLHKEGMPRLRRVEITGGMQIDGLTVNGRERPSQRLGLGGTVMSVRLRPRLAPGESVKIGMNFSFRVPEAGRAPRMGHEDNHVFYLGYWYPQVAVLDDVRGWVANQYLGRGEFYMGYGNYDLEFTAPDGWLVHATGELANPEEVLTEQTRERLARARDGRDVVRVFETADEAAPGVGLIRSDAGKLTWKFRAENVRDVAVSVSDRYRWDATHAEVPDGDSMRSVMIHSVYEKNARFWNRAAVFARHTIEFNSKFLFPYPWPHMTVCEGIIGGGMEYPMMTIIGVTRSERSVQSVTAHELIHMWFPMIVGSDEKSFAWMDEGLTSATQPFTDRDFWRQDDVSNGFGSYMMFAKRGRETEAMRPADQFPSQGPYGFASYQKTAAIMHQLRYMLGDDVYLKALREYIADWAFKHPYPQDLFNTFSRVAEQDLDWYFSAWFYETWKLDHAVESVVTEGDKTTVTVADTGRAPHPTVIAIEFEGGRETRTVVPVSHWLAGNSRWTLEIDERPVRVRIDPDRRTLDVEKSNNTWVREDEDG